MFRILVSTTCEKELTKLSKNLLKKIIELIDSLEANPFPKGVIKLKGHGDLYRIRKGDHRIIYSVDIKKRIITILIVRNSKDTYR